MIILPFLTGLWFYAGLITWCAVISVAHPETNPQTRDVGWSMATYLDRDLPEVHVPDTLPQWLLDDVAADREAEAVEAVAGYLCAVLVAVVPGHAAQVVDWAIKPAVFSSPRAGVLGTMGELDAAP